MIFGALAVIRIPMHGLQMMHACTYVCAPPSLCRAQQIRFRVLNKANAAIKRQFFYNLFSLSHPKSFHTMQTDQYNRQKTQQKHYACIRIHAALSSADKS